MPSVATIREGCFHNFRKAGRGRLGRRLDHGAVSCCGCGSACTCVCAALVLVIAVSCQGGAASLGAPSVAGS
eukprot:scaffold13893_cov27-Tisochrysis_lutea.AAC.1